MLGSSGPWGSCSNASIRCSNFSTCLCTLCTGVTSQRALSTLLTFRAVRKIRPQCQRQSRLPCSANRSSPPLMPFQFSLVNCPLLPSFPPEPTPRGSWPQGTICYLVATGFLHPVKPQAPLSTGYPAKKGNYITDPVCDTNCLVLQTPLCTVCPTQGRQGMNEEVGRRLEEPQELQTHFSSPG